MIRISHLASRFAAACLAIVAVVAVFASLPPAAAQTTARKEYRAYWVETFNSQMGTRAEIDRIIDAAVQSNANALFAQVRRRGDSWYLNSLEPFTQVPGVGEPDATGKPTFDPLAYLIQQAHARGVEVHAYVIVGTIYNAHPTITGTPTNPAHVFNTHFWDRTTNAIIPDVDPRQWSTRSLPHNLSDASTSTTFDGHRYGAEWYIDLGHPEAAAHTVEVFTHLVKNYDVDGLHLDRIRYPEAPIDRPAGQPMGINTGYNETSVQRFKARYGSQASYYTEADIGTNVGTVAAPRIITAADVGYPKTNDPLWNDWRREQVTNVVRRIYLNATAVKPQIKLSAALICFFTGPTASGGWEKTEAYYRVFQDWRAWTQEGTLDIIAPMIYKQEHTASVRAQYDDWLAFSKQLARDENRHSMPGLGVYLNGVEGSLRQTRRALARPPFDATLQPADGVIFYALGNTLPGNLTGNSTSAAVTNNPFSYPVPNASTPKRTNADFFAALRTGASADGSVRFEDPALAPLFTEYVGVPDMPWKSAPTAGYAMGVARDADGNPLDGAIVTIERTGGASRTVKTDGGGFFGALDLAPGTYRAVAQSGTITAYSAPFTVTAGAVAVADLIPDAVAPAASLSANPSSIIQNDGSTVQVTITGQASDALSGLAAVSYTVEDEYGASLSIPARALDGAAATWTDALAIEARHNANDIGGRRYRITATVTDKAGNAATTATEVVVRSPRRR